MPAIVRKMKGMPEKGSVPKGVWWCAANATEEISTATTATEDGLSFSKSTPTITMTEINTSRKTRKNKHSSRLC